MADFLLNDGNSAMTVAERKLALLLLAEWTVIQEAAPLALRRAWKADGASVADQIDMERKMFARWDQRREELMGLFVAAFVRQQFQAARDAKDVRVHRKHALLAREEQHAARRFRADAFERGEEGQRF